MPRGALLPPIGPDSRREGLTNVAFAACSKRQERTIRCEGQRTRPSQIPCPIAYLDSSIDITLIDGRICITQNYNSINITKQLDQSAKGSRLE